MNYPNYGANIKCCVCEARPYPPPGVRSDFDLVKLKSVDAVAVIKGEDEEPKPENKKRKMVPAGAGEGHWYCSREFERDGGKYYVKAEIVEAVEAAEREVPPPPPLVESVS
jgi:hypothetical protein